MREKRGGTKRKRLRKLTREILVCVTCLCLIETETAVKRWLVLSTDNFQVYFSENYMHVEEIFRHL